MRKFIGIVFTILLSFLLSFTVDAQEINMMPGRPGMPGNPGMPGIPDLPFLPSNVGHNISFKIADLDLDEVPEIVFLIDKTIIVTDNKGNLLFEKTVEGIEDDFIMSNLEEKHINPRHMDGMSGSGRLEVADINLEFDRLPEIIILDSEKLIVLDNTGELKFTIPIPEIVVMQNKN